MNTTTPGEPRFASTLSHTTSDDGGKRGVLTGFLHELPATHTKRPAPESAWRRPARATTRQPEQFA